MTTKQISIRIEGEDLALAEGWARARKTGYQRVLKEAITLGLKALGEPPEPEEVTTTSHIEVGPIPTVPVVYVVDVGGEVQIGYALKFGAKLSQLQKGGALVRILVLLTPGTKGLERELRRKFVASKVGGGFRLTSDMVAWLNGERRRAWGVLRPGEGFPDFLVLRGVQEVAPSEVDFSELLQERTTPDPDFRALLKDADRGEVATPGQPLQDREGSTGDQSWEDVLACLDDEPKPPRRVPPPSPPLSDLYPSDLLTAADGVVPSEGGEG